MRRKPLLLFLFLLASILSRAQNPEEILKNWSAKSPIEKLYLHLDRENYLAGETIWFKAYLYSEYFPDTISTSLYVELLNKSSVILARKMMPVFWGTTQGQFELADSLKTGTYFIRAYSPTMLNHGSEFLYLRDLFISGKKNHETLRPREKTIQLEFFPEGGNFLSGVLNTIAVKATNEYGLPVNVNGSVKNEKGETIVEFTSQHDGMSMFDITAKAGERYYTLLDNDSYKKKYFLPELVDKGIVFRLMPDPRGKYFTIMQRTGDPVFEAAFMIGQMQHHEVFRQDFNKPADWQTGIINTGNLGSGILQVTVFNKDGMPLAERLTFVDNREYIQPAELVIDTLNFSAKARNHFTLSLSDTVMGSFSVSITDPDYSISALCGENILSRLLITSDLKGFVNNPAYYFSEDNDSVRNALDLVMMTNGWRRFKWTELLQNHLPPLLYKDPGYITITGRVNIRDTKKPLPDKELLVMISSYDSLSNSIQMMVTDQQGRFRLDSLVFYDQTKFLVSDIRGKRNKWLDVLPDADSAARTYFLLPIDPQKIVQKEIVDSSELQAQTKLAFDYDAITKANGQMLQGVTVKARKKTPGQELEERYASGLFSGFSEKTIDLVNTNEKIYQRNIFDYLQARVPGLHVSNSGLDYDIYYRQSYMGPRLMTLYLDEIETNASYIATIPANEIAMVKVFNSFGGAFGNGPGGVLAIYTKKGSDFSGTISSSADQFRFKGYSVIKEFYSPDYEVDPNRVQLADKRITLLWQPDVFVNAANAKVPLVFHNSDRTSRFKIVVEGMTWDGRMVTLEKIISAPGKKGF